MAGDSVTFLGRATDETLEHEFARAEALIFPGLDDFGIVAVEALAAGTPVIAYQAGGALDYIQPGKNGLFFEKQTADSLAKALDDFSSHKFSSGIVMRSAQEFSAEKFHIEIKQFMDSNT
jgi:glycosyltransferase involved in cell wall biosynthesis